MGYGGPVFTRLPALRKRIAGYYLGDKLETLPRAVEEIINLPKTYTEEEPVSENFKHLAEVFAAAEPYLYAQIQGGRAIPYIAHTTIGKSIQAVLTLGDLKLLHDDIDWVSVLIQNHGLPVGMLPDYLHAYADAIRTQMGESGQDISKRLAE